MQEIKTYYVSEGNAVRKPEVVLSPARSLPTRETRQNEKIEAARTRAKITERRRKSELRKNRIMTGYMVLAVAAFCFLFVFYVR